MSTRAISHHHLGLLALQPTKDVVPHDSFHSDLQVLEPSYNKDIPPIERNRDGSAKPADVSISITLI